METITIFIPDQYFFFTEVCQEVLDNIRKGQKHRGKSWARIIELTLERYIKLGSKASSISVPRPLLHYLSSNKKDNPYTFSLIKAGYFHDPFDPAVLSNNKVPLIAGTDVIVYFTEKLGGTQKLRISRITPKYICFEGVSDRVHIKHTHRIYVP